MPQNGNEWHTETKAMSFMAQALRLVNRCNLM